MSTSVHGVGGLMGLLGEMMMETGRRDACRRLGCIGTSRLNLIQVLVPVSQPQAPLSICSTWDSTLTYLLVLTLRICSTILYLLTYPR